MKKLIYILFISLLAFPGYAESIQDKLVTLGIATARNKIKSVDFKLEDLNGKPRTLSYYRGKMVFLNFWATWCGPCRIEMPSMQRVYNELKEEGFEIVAVDLREDRKVVKKFIKENNLTFPVLLDKKGRIGAIYGVRSIPTTYLIDRDGYIIGRTIGAREWDTREFKAVFREILQNGVVYNEPSQEKTVAVNLTGDVKEFTIETYNWGFNLSPPVIRKGDKVRIRIKGTKGTHGIVIPEFDVYTGHIKKRKEEVIEFIASKTGKFPFRCNIPCGRGHMGMKGFIEIVE